MVVVVAVIVVVAVVVAVVVVVVVAVVVVVVAVVVVVVQVVVVLVVVILVLVVVVDHRDRENKDRNLLLITGIIRGQREWYCSREKKKVIALMVAREERQQRLHDERRVCVHVYFTYCSIYHAYHTLCILPLNKYQVRCIHQTATNGPTSLINIIVLAIRQRAA